MHERYLQSIRTEIKLVGKSNIDDMLKHKNRDKVSR